MKRYSPQDVWYADAGVFTLGDTDLRGLVSHALAKIPATIADRILDECLMLMPVSREKGSYIPAELLRDKALIAFAETLLDRELSEALWTILHEAAHHILGHRSPVNCPGLDYDRQEQEANDLVKDWLAQAG